MFLETIGILRHSVSQDDDCMSGHSKWSKVKHQKESTDAAKGKIFTKLANAIILAIKQGGGNTDPDTNFKLRLSIEKARSLNMPKDKIDRAVELGCGSDSGDDLTQIMYEGFGPGGVGILIETATDNKQRTVAELKNVLDRGGGSLATAGSVSHFFQAVGLVRIDKQNKSSDEVLGGALESGAIDLEDTGDTYDIFTKPSELHIVKDNLLKAGFKVSTFELFYRPKTEIPINDKNTANKLLALLTSLEDLDNVQKVHANFDIPDEILTH